MIGRVPSEPNDGGDNLPGASKGALCRVLQEHMRCDGKSDGIEVPYGERLAIDSGGYFRSPRIESENINKVSVFVNHRPKKRSNFRTTIALQR